MGQCSATQLCQCSEDETWACAMTAGPLCEEELPEDLPLWESCDPDEPLPTECPVEAPESFETNCTEYTLDKQCNYDYVYMGCSWDELQCSATQFCQCSEDETWACAMTAGPLCEEELPEDLPLWESCDPDEPLPTECPIETPVSFETNCTEYPLDKQCNYDYVYVGCSWDELQCSATQFCQCSEDETWACAMASPPLCEELPKDLPLGESCDPDESLPTAP